MSATASQQDDRIHLSEQEAREAMIGILARAGYASDEQLLIANHLLDAALCGYDYSGFPKLQDLIGHAKAKRPRKPATPVQEAPVSALIDGGNTVGMVTVDRATDDLIARASQQGFAVVGVFNSWMTGRSAYYVERIARAGLIGFHTASTFPIVAPPGGAAPALGTNPIAFSFPKTGDPLVIDMSTSAISFTEMGLLERTGGQLPENVAIDKRGRPTRDPAAAKAGALLNFAGYRGFAVSLTVLACGVMAGAAKSPNRDYGYLLVAMRPDLLTPLDTYRKDLEETLARIKATPTMEGIGEIRIPSERAFRERRRRQKDGFEVDRKIWDALQAIGKKDRAKPPNNLRPPAPNIRLKIRAVFSGMRLATRCPPQ